MTNVRTDSYIGTCSNVNVAGDDVKVAGGFNSMGKGTLQFTKNFAAPIYHWKVSIFFDLFIIGKEI